MTSKEARRASDRGFDALHKLDKSPTSDLEIIDLLADILICAELDHGWQASEIVEKVLDHVRGEIDGDEFTSEATA